MLQTRTRLLMILLLVTLAVSGCATTEKPTMQVTAFSNIPVPSEQLAPMPSPERLPNFFVLQDADGKKYPALPNAIEMGQYEKLKAYVEASEQWSRACKQSFDDSQSRSQSVIHLGKVTEEYANMLAQRVDDQKQSLKDEQSARMWDNIKNGAIQLLLVIGLGLAL